MQPVSDAHVPGEPIDVAMARVAGAQHGVFSRAQAVQQGATRGQISHRLRSGRWHRIHADVFSIAGTATTPLSALMGACLAWGEPCAISHRTAGSLWNLTGVRDGVAVPVTLPLDRRRIVHGTTRHVSTLEHVDRTAVASIPVTTPTRTMLDLAAVLDQASLEEALDDALRRGLTTIPRLRWSIDRLGRRPGAGSLRRLLATRDDRTVPQSVLETRLLRMMRRCGLPLPVIQHRVQASDGTVAIIDFAYPDAHVGIEADGYRWHGGRARWEHDRDRQNRLAEMGWRIVRITWRQLERDPEATVATIRRTLAVARSAHGRPSSTVR